MRERKDGRGDERCERGIRAEDEDPRRTQEPIDGERHDRRVQAVDGRQSRGLRVTHADRHQERAQRQPRHEIVTQPPPLVGKERLEAREPAQVRTASIHAPPFAGSSRRVCHAPVPPGSLARRYPRIALGLRPERDAASTWSPSPGSGLAPIEPSPVILDSWLDRVGWLGCLEGQLVMRKGHGTPRLVAFLEDARAQSAPVLLRRPSRP